MKQRTTYAKLLEFVQTAEQVDSNMYSVDTDGKKFSRILTNNRTKRLPQEVIISDINITENMTATECRLFCLIQRELKMYNSLWYANEEVRNNSKNRDAIKKFIELNILVKTETRNIYIVNPYYIRRGEFFTVVFTTAHMIRQYDDIRVDMITDKKPIKDFEDIHKIEEVRQIDYGFEIVDK